MAEIAATCSAH